MVLQFIAVAPGFRFLIGVIIFFLKQSAQNIVAINAAHTFMLIFNIQ